MGLIIHLLIWCLVLHHLNDVINYFIQTTAVCSHLYIPSSPATAAASG